ncbi:transglycosylase domain-containing protein [Oryzobacter sp. R7]|uniref:transglycosylase domain-containing protein n=1 Tax=Oryzobacter faecalis TaxID=3388656 RepID=UPI00398D4370
MDGRAHNVSAVLRLLLGFVVLSTVAGLLMAGLAIPAVGASGQVAKGGVAFFNDLPSEFTVSPLAQQSRILDADGKLIANPYDENRIIVPLKKISKNMQNAQIAIEDARFYEHGGLDVRGFSRAMISNLQNPGGEVQGASTLTQQFVKVTIQETALRRGDKEAARAAVDKNYARKLQELKYALNVEENFTKEQILEGYLNLVYYGDQAYGVEAAALNYFGVTAAKLDLGQSALLAGIVQQPTAYNPVLNPKDSQRRRNLVLDRMQALGMASAKDVAAAKKVDVTKMINRKPPKGVCHRSAQPYFCSFVMEYLQKSPQMAVLGKTPADRMKAINQGGLTIRTTLKNGYQKTAQKELVKAVPVNNKQNLAGAVTIIEPGTGKILAMAQATDFSKYQTNLNVDQKYGGGPNGYQIGSTAKTFALVEALERGMPLNSTITIPSTSPERPATFLPSQMKDECGTVEPWKVRNDVPVSGGPMSLREGVIKSVNPFFAALNVKLGACSVRDTQVKMGLHRADGKAISDTIAGIALGAGESTPMSVANAYATLAANGKYCEPMPITSITTPDKKEIKVPGPQCKQVISADVAAGVNDLLQSVVREGTVRRLWDSNARPAAGKTGTTEKHNQIWFAGFTPQLSTTVWVGNLKPASKSGKLYTLAGKCFGEYGCVPRVYGSTVAAPVWSKIMKAVSKGMPVKQFKAPSSDIRNGKYESFPNVIGRGIENAQRILKEAGFDSYVAGRVSSSAQIGTVAYTDPAGSALPGTSIGLYISTGQAQAQAPPEQPKPKPGRGGGGGGGDG